MRQRTQSCAAQLLQDRDRGILVNDSMSMHANTGPEIVVGLVGTIGVDLDAVASALEQAFERVTYHTRQLRLIDLLPEHLAPAAHAPMERRYRERMDAGDRFRKTLQRNDAVALLAMAGIRGERESAMDGDPERSIERCVYILRSLKRPQEVERLREVYGSSCYVVAAYAPREYRRDWLARRIAGSHHASEWDRYKTDAEDLIDRDAYGRAKYGQNVRDTFPMADVFLDAAEPGHLKRQAVRFVDLLFGHPFQTPTRDEHAMFLASGAALRSASAGRQVGATIATSTGDVVAVGTNEVATAFGGQYWGEDIRDQRDHWRMADPNATIANDILVDLFARLRKRGWLSSEKAALDSSAMLECARHELLGPMEVTGDDLASLADSAAIRDLIEFMRAVHAEMAALMSAARRGVAVDGCTLYSTSFPCHECARHIVAAGIRRVVFIEPYPKSRVRSLYDDSICIDEEDDQKLPFCAFIGIAPRLYMRAFTMPDRKDPQGHWIDWDSIRRTRQPRYAASSDSYVPKERDWVVVLREALSTMEAQR
jgi:deoxycytidylate deaminase